MKIKCLLFFIILILSCSKKKDSFFIIEKGTNNIISLEMDGNSVCKLKDELNTLIEAQHGDVYLIEGNGVDEVSWIQKTNYTLVGMDGNGNTFLYYNFRKDAPFTVEYKIDRSDTIIDDYFIISRVVSVSGEHEYKISLIPYLTSKDKEFLSRTIWPES